MTQVILYTSEDGKSQVQLRAEGGTVWLSQLEMAELFQTSKQNVAKHLKAIFADQELSEEAVVNQWLTTAADGKRYRVAHYNLDAILAVGYRSHAPAWERTVWPLQRPVRTAGAVLAAFPRWSVGTIQTLWNHLLLTL
jgi:hypothetical protein